MQVERLRQTVGERGALREFMLGLAEHVRLPAPLDHGPVSLQRSHIRVRQHSGSLRERREARSLTGCIRYRASPCGRGRLSQPDE